MEKIHMLNRLNTTIEMREFKKYRLKRRIYNVLLTLAAIWASILAVKNL